MVVRSCNDGQFDRPQFKQDKRKERDWKFKAVQPQRWLIV
jgi:hypothetical protein